MGVVRGQPSMKIRRKGPVQCGGIELWRKQNSGKGGCVNTKTTIPGVNPKPKSESEKLSE